MRKRRKVKYRPRSRRSFRTKAEQFYTDSLTRSVVGLDHGHMLADNSHANASHVRSFSRDFFVNSDAAGQLSIELNPHPGACYRTASTIVGADVSAWNGFNALPGFNSWNNSADHWRTIGYSVRMLRIVGGDQAKGYVKSIEFGKYDYNNDANRSSDSSNDSGGVHRTVTTLVEGTPELVYVTSPGIDFGEWQETVDLTVASTPDLIVSTGDGFRRACNQLNSVTIHARSLAPSTAVMFIVTMAVQSSSSDIISGDTESLQPAHKAGKAEFSVEHKTMVAAVQKTAQMLSGTNGRKLYRLGGRLLGYAHKALDIGSKAVNGVTALQRIGTAATATRQLGIEPPPTLTIQDLDTGAMLRGIMDVAPETPLLL